MSRGIRAGKAHILLSIRNRTRQGFREAQRELTAFASRTARIGLGLGVGGTALTGFFAKTVKEFSTVEQLLGRFSAVFRDLEGQASNFGDNLAKNIGQSRLAIKDQQSQFQALFQGFGFAPQNSNFLQEEFTKATQDLIAFDDTITNSQEATDKFLGGITGSNVRGVKSFGANILDSALATEVLRLGINKTTKEASQQEKILARYAIIMRALGQSGVTGQAAREINTLASRFRAFSGELRETLAGLGGAIGPAILTLTSSFTDLLVRVREFAAENPLVIQQIAIMGPAMIGLGVAATGLAATMTGLSIAIGLVSTLPVASFAVPIGAMAALGIGAYQAAKNMDLIKQTVIGLAQPFASLGNTINSAFGGISDALAGGELETAARIGLAGLELAWEQTFGELTLVYQKFINQLAKRLIAAQIALQATLNFGNDEENLRRGREQFREITSNLVPPESNAEALQARQAALKDELRALREVAEAARVKAEEERAAALAASENNVPFVPFEEPAEAKALQTRDQESRGTFFGSNFTQQFAIQRDGLEKVADVIKEGNKTAEQILDELKNGKPLVWSK